MTIAWWNPKISQHQTQPAINRWLMVHLQLYIEQEQQEQQEQQQQHQHDWNCPAIPTAKFTYPGARVYPNSPSIHHSFLPQPFHSIAINKARHPRKVV
jgi:membrane protease subunit (stomatin/prohibitin family)